MKRIVPNQPFLDGTDRYEKDETYSVEDAKAFYFCQVGWADYADEETPVAVEPQNPEVDLEIQNASLNMKDSNG